jgi:hypothetical protein
LNRAKIKILIIIKENSEKKDTKWNVQTRMISKVIKLQPKRQSKTKDKLSYPSM